jgi:hypothetical protein
MRKYSCLLVVFFALALGAIHLIGASTPTAAYYKTVAASYGLQAGLQKYG